MSNFELGIFGFDGFVNVSQHLNEDLKGIESQRVLFLRCDYTLMFTFQKLALCNFGQRVNGPLEYILLLVVAIIVDKYFKQMLSVLTQFVKDIQNQILVVVNRVARVQNAKENLLKEYHNLLLEVLSEVEEQTVED